MSSRKTETTTPYGARELAGALEIMKIAKMRACSVAAASLLTALATAAAEETDRSGPFLGVTALSPAPTGIVFRIAWAHHYRPGGAHGPNAAGHLSRIYTPRPDPSLAHAPATADADEESDVTAGPDLDSTMLDSLGEAVLLNDLDEQPEAAPLKTPEPEAHHHDPASEGPPAPPTSLLFSDPAAKWLKWSEALEPRHHLNPGEGSHRLDLGRHGIAPAPGPATATGLAPDHAMLLYVRAFAGEKLSNIALKLRLDLYQNQDDTEPLASHEMTSGPFGIQVSRPNSKRPQFETDESVAHRWREETRRILSNRGGTDYFAAPDGRHTGRGTRKDPWDLESALLRKNRIGPGDTLWLRGGIYDAPPHRMRPPVPVPQPGANDKPPPPALDSVMSTPGQEGLDLIDSIVDEIMDPALEAKRKKEEEAQRLVTRHYFTCELYGTLDAPVIVRQYPGEHAALRGGLRARGAHVWFWGFELSEPPERANSRRNSSHFLCNTIGARLINLHLHGGDKGLLWSAFSRFDVEMYGCIIHDFGYPHVVPAGTPHYLPQVGVGMSPLGGIRRVTDNMIFHGYGYNLQAPLWSEGMHSMILEGNIIFAAGMKQAGWSTANVLANWHQPLYRFSLIENVFHQPVDTADNVQSIGYTELMRTQSGELNLRGNVFDGGRRGAHIGTWNAFDVAGNTFRGKRILAAFYPIGDLSDARSWDRNTYIALRASPKAGTKEGDPLLNFWGRKPTFKEWQAASRLDANSRFVDAPASLSAPPIVNVRPNLYESGRAHVTVVGWGKRESVDVDLSAVLTKGDAYRVFSVQQMEKPLTEATYEAGTVAFTRTGSKRTPDFDAYLVLRDLPDDVKDVPARSP